MKKLIVIIFVLISSIAAYNLYSYFNTYKINDDKKRFEDEIYQRFNKASSFSDQIDIIQSLELKNRKYVIYLIKDKLGYAEFTRGINNKYKLGVSGFGTSMIYYYIDKVNSSKYFILFGKNYKNSVSYAELALDHNSYRIPISAEDYYISYCKVPNTTKVIYPEISQLKFYENGGQDITNEVISQ